MADGPRSLARAEVDRRGWLAGGRASGCWPKLGDSTNCLGGRSSSAGCSRGIEHCLLQIQRGVPFVTGCAFQPSSPTQFNVFDYWLPAVSADGTHIVFPVWDGHEKRLWLRAINDTGEGKALPGTENGGLPFWSPDGRSIGFFADGKLKRIDIEGNLVQVLCDVPVPRGGTWSQDGVILFAPQTTALYQIPANGGTARLVTELNATRGEQSHRWPVFLADGKHFLFFVRNERHPEVAGIYAGSLDSKDYHLVVKATIVTESAIHSIRETSFKQWLCRRMESR